MLILDSNTKSLQIILGAAVAASQLPFTTSYIDLRNGNPAYGAAHGVTNNTTPVTMVDVPVSGVQRQIKAFTIQNADIVSAKVFVVSNSNGTLRNLFVATLGAGDNLAYEDGRGFAVFDSTGAIKQSVGNDLANKFAALVRKPQVVATSCSLHNSSWGNGAGGRSDTRIDNRVLYNIAGNQPITQLQVAAMGFALNPTGEQIFTTDLTYEAAVEILSPASYERAFLSNTALTTVPNGIPYILSPPLMYDFAPGSSFYLRQSYSVAATTSTFPAGSLGGPSGSAGYVSAAASSQVAGTGAYTNPSGGASFGGPKTVVLGIPAAPMPAVAFVGDSIADGNNDTIDSNGNIGFIMRGLWNVGGKPMASLKQTMGSWTYGKCTIDTSPRLRAFWPFVTHVLFELGTNDIAAAVTLPTLQGYALQNWQAAKRVIGPYGKPLQVAQSLIMPRTTSTDSWATPGNQTPAAGFTIGGVRDQFNAWVKTQVGQGLLDAVIDPNQYVEDQLNPGKWLTNGSANYPSTDGVHPSTALHILAAQAVNSWAQTLAA